MTIAQGVVLAAEMVDIASIALTVGPLEALGVLGGFLVGIAFMGFRSRP